VFSPRRVTGGHRAARPRSILGAAEPSPRPVQWWKTPDQMRSHGHCSPLSPAGWRGCESRPHGARWPPIRASQNKENSLGDIVYSNCVRSAWTTAVHCSTVTGPLHLLLRLSSVLPVSPNAPASTVCISAARSRPSPTLALTRLDSAFTRSISAETTGPRLVEA